MHPRFVLIFLLTCLFTSAIAQKEITVEDFTTKNTFAERTVTGINWMNDGKFYSTLEGNRIVRYNIATGQPVETLLDGNQLSPALVIQQYSFSADEQKLLVLNSRESVYRRSFTAEYYVYDRTAKTLTPLSSQGRQSYATFSPDGKRVAFVRKNNVFYVDLETKTETQVTSDGQFNAIINGTTDWVYEEEFSFVEGFYWSPDGKKLAYYRFDESAVKEYDMQVWGTALYPREYKFKYPKAGETNSSVEVWIYDLASRQKVRAALPEEKDFYIPRVKWTTHPNVLSVSTLNRLQNHFQLFHADATTGACTRILNEKNETYVDLELLDDLIYLQNGKQFIRASESSGFKHFYLHNLDGSLVQPITTGAYEISTVVGFDEKTRTLYYTGTEASPMQRQFYSISFDGKKKAKLSAAAGTHVINMSPDFQFYLDYHNSTTQPNVVSLYQTKKNTLVKVLEKNENLSKIATEYKLAQKEFFTYKTVDGTELNGMMMKPEHFDASKKYPVLVYQYSGPGSQNVTDAFTGSHYYFHQLLTQKGYIVAVIDTRGTGGRGEAFRKVTYKQLGKLELEDHIAGAKFLSGLSYVDGKRIGIWGWSYGGYMASLAMTKGGDTFTMGIAVAPVTNWRFYDTIYTERYLQTPALNATGYDDNSPLTYAANLQGNFLLVHGTGDDNVHFQNSTAFENALINAGKQFRSFYYPDKHHGIQGAKTRQHLYTMLVDYVVEHL
ncbi:MAG TPA: S9 family peptidase [Chryseolinea sp.]